MNDRQVKLTMAPDAINFYWEYTASVLFPMKHKTQFAWILYGPLSGNGKSTDLDTKKRIVGVGNFVTIPLQELNHHSSYNVAELEGKRANLVGDMEKAPIRDSDVIKSALLGEEVSAHEKYKKPRTFKFRGSSAFGTNHVFREPGGGEAWIRRFKHIYFPNRVIREGDSSFNPEELRTDQELSGIFNRVLDALDKLESHGWKFETPRSARFVERLFRENNREWLIDEWLTDSKDSLFKETVNGQSRVKRGDAWKAFQTWVTTKGIPLQELPERNKVFHPHMRVLFDEKRFQDCRCYLVKAAAKPQPLEDPTQRTRQAAKKRKPSHASSRGADEATGEVLPLKRTPRRAVS